MASGQGLNFSGVNSGGWGSNPGGGLGNQAANWLFQNVGGGHWLGGLQLLGALIPGLGNLLGSPAVQGLVGQAMAPDMQAAIDEANAANAARQARIEDIFGDNKRYNQTQIDRLERDYSSMYGTLRDQSEAGYSDLDARFGNLRDTTNQNFRDTQSQTSDAYTRARGAVEGRLSSLTNRLGGAYDERLANAMGLISGVGQQLGRDIDERFSGLQSQATAGLAERGLRGTTIAPSIQQSVERERNSEQRRLAEDQARMQAEYYSRLSGEGLLSQERLGSQLADTLGRLGLASAGATERLGAARSSLDAALGEAQIGTAERGNQNLQNLGQWYMGSRDSTLNQTLGNNNFYTSGMTGMLERVNDVAPDPGQNWAAWNSYQQSMAQQDAIDMQRDAMRSQEQMGYAQLGTDIFTSIFAPYLTPFTGNLFSGGGNTSAPVTGPTGGGNRAPQGGGYFSGW